jgi:hypothetical protein
MNFSVELFLYYNYCTLSHGISCTFSFSGSHSLTMHLLKYIRITNNGVFILFLEHLIGIVCSGSGDCSVLLPSTADAQDTSLRPRGD